MDVVESTLSYYNENAERCFQDAFTISERTNQDRFCALVRQGGHILDLGCGSGRDTAYFRSKGFEVTPVDGASRLCRLASLYLGTPVRTMEFTELDDVELYDGIYASASIMHLDVAGLEAVLPRIERALLSGGVFYTCFKYGDEDGFVGRRYQTKMTEERLMRLVAPLEDLELCELGTFGNEHPKQFDFRWLYALMRKR